MATVNIVKCSREKGIRYQVYYKAPHRRKKKNNKTFTKQREVQQASNELRALLDTGKLPDSKKKFRMMTFSEVAEELFTEWNLKLQARDLRAKTVDDYIYTLNMVKKEFGHMLIREISKDQVTFYRTKVSKELSIVSSNKRLAAIKKVFV